jgi:hypothetical protein
MEEKTVNEMDIIIKKDFGSRLTIDTNEFLDEYIIKEIIRNILKNTEFIILESILSEKIIAKITQRITNINTTINTRQVKQCEKCELNITDIFNEL